MCDYIKCNDALKCSLGGMIIATEKLQTQGDSLDESDSALENNQNKENVISMFQDIAKHTQISVHFWTKCAS